MEIFGYTGAFAMGISLGLIGGGGSILTVPILVYLFSIDSFIATSYSLFVVGITSFVGSISHILQGNVSWKTVYAFGIPSIISVLLTRHFLVPHIPETILQLGGLVVTKSIFILILFAVLMIFASYSMIKKGTMPCDTEETQVTNYPTLILQGFFVGLITGSVGAGGGFLIIPALVYLAGLSMKKAIGSSLIIITLNSLVGFLGNFHNPNSINWHFLFIFSFIAIIGILVGSTFSKKVSNEKLKPTFGYFVLVMGIYILSKELFFHHT